MSLTVRTQQIFTQNHILNSTLKQLPEISTIELMKLNLFA